jgi:hypothetical protein
VDLVCVWYSSATRGTVQMNFYHNFYQNYQHKNTAGYFYPNQSDSKKTKNEETKSTSAKSDTGYASADSSVESEDEKELNHILEPQNTNCSPNGPRKCLAWACKACKKKTVAIDRRKAATLRERRRLRKVRICVESNIFNVQREIIFSGLLFSINCFFGFHQRIYFQVPQNVN